VLRSVFGFGLFNLQGTKPSYVFFPFIVNAFAFFIAPLRIKLRKIRLTKDGFLHVSKMYTALFDLILKIREE
ncbi:hypothetical protein AAHB54_18955, partial [Bacillus cereus]